MESRRIVKSGNTSFNLSLPINWIRKNKLDQERLVFVGENDEGDLIISGQVMETDNNTAPITIDIDKKQDPFTSVLQAYLSDHR